MNWKLIFLLSLFGLAMSIATVYWIPGKIEPAFWLVIFILCAYFIAKNAPGKYFLHGFLVSLVNCVYIVCAHVLFYKDYITTNPEMKSMGKMMPFFHGHPRIQMIITGPF